MPRFTTPLSAVSRAALSTTAGALAKFIRTTIEGPGKKYHPEQHYMRGPGPKWREKHSRRGTRGL
jgi:hypothetical protein